MLKFKALIQKLIIINNLNHKTLLISNPNPTLILI